MNISKKFFLIIPLLVFASLTRLIPHAPNFTAIGALALFGGAIITDKRLAFLLPLVVMLFTDAIIGFHSSMIPVYLCFTASVFIGMTVVKKVNVFTVSTASLSSSVLFFLVTNLPFWYVDMSLYPLTWQGTLLSYTEAIPFFGNQLAGDFFYSSILFSTFVLFRPRLAVELVVKK